VGSIQIDRGRPRVERQHTCREVKRIGVRKRDEDSGRKECARGGKVRGKGYANSAQKEERGVGRYEGKRSGFYYVTNNHLRGVRSSAILGDGGSATNKDREDE